MCDTMVVLPACSGDGSLLFAKNSDREPNEPHIIVKVPRREIEAGEKVDCTYIPVDNSGREGQLTNEVLLFKPSWIWGAEMGVNEKGLVIGNEAVFTREKVEDRALLGMDILRLALELCSDAKEALGQITELTEKYGQGGKAGYTENLKYHNSYIIADHNEAYILETAGRHWIYEKVKDVRSISNTLSIGASYDGRSSRLMENAVSKGWCRSSAEFDFKSCYESRIHPFFTKGDVRRHASEQYLKERIGRLDIDAMKAILRSHNSRTDVEDFRTGSMECLCMHAGGGLITSQTTGSLIVQLKNGEVNAWATGSSLPCVSVFKPIWFSSFDNTEDCSAAEGLWNRLEQFHRRILDGSIVDMAGYFEKRDMLEQELTTMASEALNDAERRRITEYAFQKEMELLTELAYDHSNRDKSGLYYRLYWKRQNSQLRNTR